MKFWPTTWGRLLADDELLAPDDTVWVVIASVVEDMEGHWLIHPVGASGCTEIYSVHKVTEPVLARRGDQPLPDANGVAAALDVLRTAFPDVEIVPGKDA